MWGRNTRVVAVEFLVLSMRNITGNNIYRIKNNGKAIMNFVRAETEQVDSSGNTTAFFSGGALFEYRLTITTSNQKMNTSINTPSN
jgi:D-mannonate dehydratase